MNQHWYRTLKLPSPSIAFHLPPSPSVEPSSLSIPFHLPRSPSGATHDRVAQLYQVAACMQSHSYLHIVARSSYFLVPPRSSSFISLSLRLPPQQQPARAGGLLLARLARGRRVISHCPAAALRTSTSGGSNSPCASFRSPAPGSHTRGSNPQGLALAPLTSPCRAPACVERTRRALLVASYTTSHM